MEQYDKMYSKKRIEKHRELTELKFLKKKSLFANITGLIFMISVLTGLYYLESTQLMLLIYGLVFLMLVVVNTAFYAYGDHYNNLKISMYFTILGLYSVVTSLIIVYSNPSVFTLLFLVYAIAYLYQDPKATFLNNMLLFSIGTLIIFFIPESFAMVGAPTPTTLYLFVFLFIFILLLLIASFVLIKRKLYFYHTVSKIKERELEIIKIIFDLQKSLSNNKIISDDYYKSYNAFFKELSKKIGIDNIFAEKIKILSEMSNTSNKELQKKYPSYSMKELQELKQLEMHDENRIAFIAFKAAQSNSIDLDKKDLFSETEFKSLNHYNDDLHVKIIAFSVFYTLLKTDKAYLEKLNESQIFDLIKETEIEYMIDNRVFNIYKENSDVFEKIIEDAQSKKVSK